MILIDFSGTVHAAVHVDVRAHNDTSKEFLRHVILNQIRSVRKRFFQEYGELVICMDSRTGYWRKDIFPYYKAKRKEARDKSDIDWDTVFSYINEISQEIYDYLPYKVLRIDKAEADDIIGTLVLNQEDDLEPILIVSNDHDFKQLHGIKNVNQYFPFAIKCEKITEPNLFLTEHILKGDPGDGIPNVRSARDIFLQEGMRQKPITKKYIRDFLDNGSVPLEDVDRFEENKRLIDLRYIPIKLQTNIIEAYKTAPYGNRFKLFTYLSMNGLKQQIDNISDF